MDLSTHLGPEPKHGEQSRIARLVGCQPQLVYQWHRKIRQTPVTRCPALERATEGAVTCEHQRPDVRWVRVMDSAWPWHPAGRPIADTSVLAQPLQANGKAAEQAAA
jgi:DNA-binding transcriptional regulator YdaS (Cro superfamily)